MTQVIRFTCPHCGKRLRFKASSAGKRVRCPNTDCARSVEVPMNLKEELAEPPKTITMGEATNSRRWLCACLLVAAGILTVVGTVAPWAKLSGTGVLFGSVSWNGFGGDVYEMRVNNVVLWQNPGVAESLGYVTLSLGLAILVLGVLRLRNWSPSVNLAGKIAAVIIAVVTSLVSVLLILAISSWLRETKERVRPGVPASYLDPSFGLGMWILMVGAIVAVAGAVIWPSHVSHLFAQLEKTMKMMSTGYVFNLLVLGVVAILGCARVREAPKHIGDASAKTVNGGKAIVGTGPEFPATLTNSIGMKLRRIPPGKFLMGSPPGEPMRYAGDLEALKETQYEVTIPDAIYMGAYEVTAGQFERLMGEKTTRAFSDAKGEIDLSNHPAGTSLAQALAFCNKLSDLLDEKKHGRSYRLPTEAEWEYACRAGSRTVYYFGDDPKDLDQYAWYKKQGLLPHPVGQLKPNAFGLYDMLGNVEEYCVGFRKSGDRLPSDKQGYQGTIRGGSISSTAEECRIARRSLPIDKDFDQAGINLGFRVVCILRSVQ